MRVVAFVPAKAVSRRVPEKNYKDFCGIKGGLLSLKLEQLRACDTIDDVIIYTDIPTKLFTRTGREKIMGRKDDPDISTKQLHADSAALLYSMGYTDYDIIVWAQVTNPLFTRYDEAVARFRWENSLSGVNSVLGVEPIQEFIVDDGCFPLNYDWTEEVGFWPRTQTMYNIYKINSTVSVVKLSSLRTYSDRVVKPVEFFLTNSVEGLDIDTEDDFERAEYFYAKHREV